MKDTNKWMWPTVIVVALIISTFVYHLSTRDVATKEDVQELITNLEKVEDTSLDAAPYHDWEKQADIKYMDITNYRIVQYGDEYEIHRRGASSNEWRNIYDGLKTVEDAEDHIERTVKIYKKSFESHTASKTVIKTFK